MEPILYRLTVLGAFCSIIFCVLGAIMGRGDEKVIGMVLAVLLPIGILLVYHALHWAITGKWSRKA
jgi:hypothetical protein